MNGYCKTKMFQFRSYLIGKCTKFCLFLLIKSCRLHFEGLEKFLHIAKSEKCILIMWHNRLAIAPFILSQYTPQIQYAALVSGSRDGDILSAIIESYNNGHTIRVPHLERYKALQDIIRHIEERKYIVIITPDGPRGPKYEVKPGIAIAALETEANMISLNWKAEKYWELNSWDHLRIPKPFTRITITFTCNPGIVLPKDKTTLHEARSRINEILPQN